MKLTLTQYYLLEWSDLCFKYGFHVTKITITIINNNNNNNNNNNSNINTSNYLDQEVKC